MLMVWAPISSAEIDVTDIDPIYISPDDNFFVDPQEGYLIWSGGLRGYGLRVYFENRREKDAIVNEGFIVPLDKLVAIVSIPGEGMQMIEGSLTGVLEDAESICADVIAEGSIELGDNLSLFVEILRGESSSSEPAGQGVVTPVTGEGFKILKRGKCNKRGYFNPNYDGLKCETQGQLCSDQIQDEATGAIMYDVKTCNQSYIVRVWKDSVRRVYSCKCESVNTP